LEFFCADRDISVVKKNAAISNLGSFRRFHAAGGPRSGAC